MNLTKKSNVGPLSDGRRSDNDRRSGIDILSKKKTAGGGTAGPAHQIAFGQGQAIGTSLRI
ncbi:MAG: hypothetical protein WCA25_13225, partial [Pseudolabrys sp.]